MMDKWMDKGHMEGQMQGKIMLSCTLILRGSDVASLVEFPPGGDSVADGCRRRDTWKNVALAHHEGK